ncbi:MAG: DsbA family protein [Sandaracinaceae bacterium]|nr:DsbA family protein [Sandaracinaceae bacterium]
MRRVARLSLVLLVASCGASTRARPVAEDGDGPWAERGDIRARRGADRRRARARSGGAAGHGGRLQRPRVPSLPRGGARARSPGALAPGQRAPRVPPPPLPFHEHAQLAAEATEEARAQGGDEAFWRYHDRVVTGRLAPSDLLRYAEELGLDGERFALALRGRVHRDRVERDLALADALGVDGTPTLFVNGRPVLGVPPAPELDAIMGEEIALAREAVARGIARGELYARAMEDARRARSRRRRAAAPEEAAPEEPEPLPAEPQRARLAVPPDAPRRGAAQPALVVQVFSDFECPFCGRVQPTLARLLEEHEDVQLVFRHYPLPSHPGARAAAIAAVEVHRQLGDAGFWAFHDQLFEARARLDADALVELAVRVGADGDGVRAAITTERHARIVDADVAAVARAGLRIGTPAFLVGERVLLGAQPYEAFDRAVREERGSVIDTPDGPP